MSAAISSTPHESSAAKVTSFNPQQKDVVCVCVISGGQEKSFLKVVRWVTAASLDTNGLEGTRNLKGLRGSQGDSKRPGVAIPTTNHGAMRCKCLTFLHDLVWFGLEVEPGECSSGEQKQKDDQLSESEAASGDGLFGHGVAEDPTVQVEE